MSVTQGLKSADTGELVSLEKIDVEVSIEGLCANVDAVIHYRNLDFVPIGAQFYCMLGDHFVLYKFEAEIQDRIIAAECVEKKKLEEDLNDAIANIRRRYKYSPPPEDSFRCYLGNLPPDTSAIIRMSLACELHVEPDGSVYFQLPTVLNPPYSQFFEDVRGNSGNQGKRISNGNCRDSQLSLSSSFNRSSRFGSRSSWRNSWASWASGGCTPSPSANTSFTYTDPTEVPYTLQLCVFIKSFQEIKDVRSRQTKISVNYLNTEHTMATVSLPNGFHFSKLFSFRIHYEDRYNPNVLWEKGNKDRGGILAHDILMIDFCPDLSETITIPKKSNKGEFIFFVDRSGSMRGDKIRSARMALVTFLKSLPVGCYFNVIGFGNDYHMLFSGGSKVYNKQNLEKAMQFQNTIHSNMGGSELLRPLKNIYRRRPMKSHPRKLFILTDGDVLDKHAVIEIVQKNSKNTRVFTYGIGDNVSASLVKGLARAGKGKYEFIRDYTKIQSKITSVLKCAMKPCVSDINIVFELPEFIKVQQIPVKISALYSGQRLIVYAVMESSQPIPTDLIGSVAMVGNVGGKEYEQKLEFYLTGSYSSQAPIHRLATRAQVNELEMDDDEIRNSFEYRMYTQVYSPPIHVIEARVVLMSVLMNIKSRYTTFVAYNKQTGERVADPMRNHLMSTRRRRQPGRSASTTSLHRSSSQRKVREEQHSSLYMVLRKFFSIKASSAKGQVVKANSMPSLFQKKQGAAPLADVTSELKVSQWDLGFNTDKEWKQFLRNISAPVGLIQLQNFDGSWDFNKKLCYILEVPSDDVEKACPYKDDRVWATLLAVWFLRDRYYDKQDEWEMIEIKAIQWLNDQDEVDNKDVDEQIEKAGKMLLKVRRKHGGSGVKNVNHVKNGSCLSWDYMTTGVLTPEKKKMAEDALNSTTNSLLNTSASVQSSVQSETGTLVANQSIRTVSELQFDTSFEMDAIYNFGSQGILLGDTPRCGTPQCDTSQCDTPRCDTPVIKINGQVPHADLDELDTEIVSGPTHVPLSRTMVEDLASLDGFNPFLQSLAQSSPMIVKKRFSSSSSFAVQYESAV